MASMDPLLIDETLHTIVTLVVYFSGTRFRKSDPVPTTGTGSSHRSGSIHGTGSSSGRHGVCSRYSRHRSIPASAVTVAAAVALAITLLQVAAAASPHSSVCG